jgi:hypothetical protein
VPLIVWVLATTLPAASATVTCVVFFDSPLGTPAFQGCVRAMSILARRSAA